MAEPKQPKDFSRFIEVDLSKAIPVNMNDYKRGFHDGFQRGMEMIIRKAKEYVDKPEGSST